MVELVPITRDNWRAAVGVRVAEGQLPYVAAYEPVALIILAKAFLRVADLDWWPMLITEDGKPRGVVALVDERGPRSGLAIFHLVIDRDQQRRGYGRAALQAIVSLAERTQGCERLSLTVHPENSVAIALYRSQGFVDDGVAEDGDLRMLADISVFGSGGQLPVPPGAAPGPDARR